MHTVPVNKYKFIHRTCTGAVCAIEISIISTQTVEQDERESSQTLSIDSSI